MADYPTEKELQQIENWPFGKWKELMDFIHDLWQYADDGFWHEKGKTYKLATAGWSGNEDIIRALRENCGFWAQCWQLTAKGGLHVFRLP